jgi:microcompartment protein CcmL/EutN
MDPALAIVEFDSIAHGIAAGDAMAKRAPLDVLYAGTIHPGRYLLLAGGGTAEVAEAIDAATATAGGSLLGCTFLPDVHPEVVAALGGARHHGEGGEALGIIETRTVATVIRAADAGIKHADVTVRELRVADELGGKGYVLFGGELTEVEAAIEEGLARIATSDHPVTHVIIARLHPEMDDNLRADPRFLHRVAGASKTTTTSPHGSR